MTVLSPEQAAKKALHDILTDRYATSDEPAIAGVTVFRGPPPAATDADRIVWVGGHVADDNPDALAGQSGPTSGSRLTVTLFVDVADLGEDPNVADDLALAIAHDVRTAIRDAIRNRVQLDHPGMYWLTVTGSRSDGPQPMDGGGWVSTVAVPVRFTVRIR